MTPWCVTVHIAEMSLTNRKRSLSRIGEHVCCTISQFWSYNTSKGMLYFHCMVLARIWESLSLHAGQAVVVVSATR